MGCGPGNSTKGLKDKFPTAKIIGADNSDEMLEKARELYHDIAFINLDANGDLHEVNEKFDIVFSNACIQWLTNHNELLPKLITLLKPNGILAIQIPLQRKHPVHIIINELANTQSGGIKSRQDNIKILRQRNTLMSFLILQMTLKYGKRLIAIVCRVMKVSLNGRKGQGCVLILNSFLKLSLMSL